MDMPTLGPAHDALQALVGRWAGTEDLAAAPWAPASTAHVDCEYRRALNGFAVIQNYRQRREDGSEFLGHNVFTVDPRTGETLWYGFDSYGFPPEPAARGGWTGATLVLEKKTARGVARHRLTRDGDTLTHEIDVRMGDDDEFRPFLRGRYTRENGQEETGDAPPPLL
ncbi:DUF1579 family protein [Amycolatopsis australiensis]|uniref:DUF1579 domain-containing protein n=1 Tax=Amycolatopsis australiensis TaxID=546364 RepID=A0A1K1QKR9_9PSEU|nr:DUF1579 family protein [Amycolatopsis australiensis]SFW60538.1 Protein of unknown function [Amycolatopsis australiensis]